MLLKNLLKKKKGFTLMELIVVIAILAVFMLILVPTMSGFIEQAKLQSLSANAETVYRATTAVKLQWELEGKDPFRDERELKDAVLEMAGIPTVGIGQDCFYMYIYYDKTDDNNFLGMAYHDTKSNTTIYKQTNTNWTYDQINFGSNTESITITNLTIVTPNTSE